jgi:hypothetical protein
MKKFISTRQWLSQLPRYVADDEWPAQPRGVQLCEGRALNG